VLVLAPAFVVSGSPPIACVAQNTRIYIIDLQDAVRLAIILLYFLSRWHYKGRFFGDSSSDDEEKKKRKIKTGSNILLYRNQRSNTGDSKSSSSSSPSSSSISQ
jgi:hypothetical protein